MYIVYNLKIKTALFIMVVLCLFTLTFGIGVAKAHAQETDTAALQAQISELLDLIADLQEQVAGLQAEVTQLTRTLTVGTTGDDVEELQRFLAEDPALYPEGLVTGYFGPLTSAAVQRLQERFGIEQVGVVGPMTRNTVNQLFQKRGRGNGQGNAFEQVIFNQNETDEEDGEDEESEDIDLSEFTPGVTGVLVCHKPGGNPNAQKTIAVGGPAVQAHLGHGDTLGSCDGDEEEEEENDEDEEEEEEEEEDETAPVIDEVAVGDISTTSATVSWETDEDADSTVWYSTDEGFDVGDAGVEEATDSDLVTDHSIELDDLEEDTTYYFIVGSEDEAGNESESDEESFTTDS